MEEFLLELIYTTTLYVNYICMYRYKMSYLTSMTMYKICAICTDKISIQRCLILVLLIKYTDIVQTSGIIQY